MNIGLNAKTFKATTFIWHNFFQHLDINKKMSSFPTALLKMPSNTVPGEKQLQKNQLICKF